MPTYVYQCRKCNDWKEVTHTMDECSKPSALTIVEIICPVCGLLMGRIPCVPQLMGFEGGSTTSEQSKLQKKQKSLKERSRTHFMNEGIKEVKDPDLRMHFEKSIKTNPVYTKHAGKDHEKWRTE